MCRDMQQRFQLSADDLPADGTDDEETGDASDAVLSGENVVALLVGNELWPLWLVLCQLEYTLWKMGK